METASRQLIAKFDAARALLEESAKHAVCPDVTTALSTELSALSLRFALSTSHLYVEAAGGETSRIAAASEFARILAAEDFSGDVDRLVLRGESSFRASGVVLRDESGYSRASSGAKRGRGARGRPRGGGRSESCTCGKRCLDACRFGGPGRPRAVSADVSAALQRLLDVYPRSLGEAAAEVSLAGGAAPQINYELCPTCAHEMSIDANRSELRCSECGTIQELVGTVFDDAQFYSQEGQKAKSGTFNPNRHFQFWWMHILAREPEEEIGSKDDPDDQYGEKLLELLRGIVVRDHKILRLLTVANVREMLREVGRTNFNKNVPLIMKKLTGIGPPQIADAVAARVENLFTKAIEVGERIRSTGRVNRNYYPFYILKILAQVLPENDFESRRVLYYIYIQSKETVEADDADWEQICIELPELTYVPTDRSMGAKYGPANTH